MANIFETTQYVLDETLIRFINYLNFAKTANRTLEGKFGEQKYATGQTMNFRLEERFLGGEGATASEESLVQIIRPLSINQQFHSMVSFSGMELTFDRARDQPYLDMMLNPRAKTLANLVEKYVATTNFEKQTYAAVGTPGVPVSRNTIFLADAYMTELAIPEDGNRYFANSPRISAELSNDLSAVFNNTVNTGALLDGFIGHLSGFDFFKTNFLTRQIAGVGQAGGAPPTGFRLGGLVTGPVSSGSTLNLTSLVASSQVFNKGDSIEIADAAGVYMVNPLTRLPLAQRAQFVVTADVISDVSGNAVVPISPEIVTTGARQNISAAIPNGAQVLLALDHNISIAYHNQAIVFAAPPITELKGGVEAVTSYSDLYKMAITCTLGADIRNYSQLDRMDIICGVTINPEFAVRVRS